MQSKIYEQPAMWEAAGETLRPGGLSLTARLMEYCAFDSGAKVLDVGCGSGVTVEYLIDRYKLAAMGIDPSRVLLDRGLRRNPRLPLLCGRGEKLPLTDASLDGIITECTLSLITDLNRLLAEFSRVLKPAGKLLLSDLYFHRGMSVKDRDFLPPAGCFQGAKTKENWIAQLERNGFKVVLWEDHTNCLKELTARIIMQEGSLAGFWSRLLPAEEGCASQVCAAAIRQAKPGYFLLVAEKCNLGGRRRP